MAKSTPQGGDNTAEKAPAPAVKGRESGPLETPISVQTKEAEKQTTTTTPAEEPDQPVMAKLPYPHNRLVIPQAITATDGGRVDLVITREWTKVPADLVRRVKDTARRARIKLALAVPDNEQEG